VVALIQGSKFEEALKFIEKSKLTHLVFEKSYIEYRLNKPEKSLKTIEDAKLNPLPSNLKELKAQILYRLERFEDCFDLYKDIIKTTSDDYEDERTTNLSAVVANLNIEGSVSNITVPLNTITQRNSNSRKRNSPFSEKTPTNCVTITPVDWLVRKTFPRPRRS
jgi:signal recognition particle subunit SRP72